MKKTDWIRHSSRGRGRRLVVLLQVRQAASRSRRSCRPRSRRATSSRRSARPARSSRCARVDVGSQVSGVVKEIYADFNSHREEGPAARGDRPVAAPGAGGHPEGEHRAAGDGHREPGSAARGRKKQLERTQAAVREAAASISSSSKQAELAVKTREAQIDSAEKQLVQAEAEPDAGEAERELHEDLRADRRRGRRPPVDVGQTVQASMTTPPFFVLATRPARAEADGRRGRGGHRQIRPDMEVTFTVDAYGGSDVHGTVDAVRLNATTTNNVVTYPVWIKVPNPDLRLRPSMTATRQDHHLDARPNVVRVPNPALRFRPNDDIYTALGLEPPARRTRAVARRPRTTTTATRTAAAAAGRRRAGGQGARRAAQGAAGRGQPAHGAPGGQQGGDSGRRRAGGGRRAAASASRAAARIASRAARASAGRRGMAQPDARTACRR